MITVLRNPKTGKYYLHTTARNNEIIVPSQQYVTLAAVCKNIRSSAKVWGVTVSVTPTMLRGTTRLILPVMVGQVQVSSIIIRNHTEVKNKK